MNGLILLALLIGGVWFWLDSRRAHEFAVGVCRHICDTEKIVLLDQTVALSSLKLARGESGWIQFVRRYTFEYSDNVSERHTGELTLRGTTPETLKLYGREMTLVDPD
jgi:hypothetical protein